MRASAALIAIALSARALCGAAEPATHIAVHHQLSVRIDPRIGAIEGTDHLHVSRGIRQFTLAKGLTVRQLAIDGTAVAVNSDAGRWPLGITNSDTPHWITVEYRGMIAGAEPDAGLLIDPAGTFLTGGGWYPTVDADELSYDLTVEVPFGQLAVAPGKLLSERMTEQGYTARFASQGPMEEVALFAGPYGMTERQHHGRRLRTYFQPSVADLADTYLQKTGQYIDFYEGWIDAYPYSSFDIVSGQRPLGLGFPGLTYVGAMVLRLPFLPETSLGHEVLHSWWGNAVQVDASRGNWAEGLTTFMADYTYEERKGESEARAMRLRWMREYAALPRQNERPLSAFRSRGHTESQVIGYHKAAMVFLMLRDEIGVDAFDRGIRRFWEQERFRRASWDDLQHAFEASNPAISPGAVSVAPGVRSAPLGRFFSQWLERTGAPVLALQEAAVRTVTEGFALAFVLSQPERPYRLRVPVVIEHDGGSTTEVVRLEGRSKRYDIRTAQRPQRICVDPDFRLFRRPLPGEVAPILRAVVFDAAARAVIAADGVQAAAAARALAARLLERAPQVAKSAPALPNGPVLLVGTDAAVDAVLKRQKVTALPAQIAGRGTARAWAAQRPGKGVLITVSGSDAAALEDVSGVLPHYGSESFVVFDGRRAIDRGVWSVGPSPLCAAPSEQ